MAKLPVDKVSKAAAPRDIIVKAVHEIDEEDSGDETLLWSDFRQACIYRRVELTTPNDVDKIEAEYKRGMLEIEADNGEVTGAGTIEVFSVA